MNIGWKIAVVVGGILITDHVLLLRAHHRNLQILDERTENIREFLDKTIVQSIVDEQFMEIMEAEDL